MHAISSPTAATERSRSLLVPVPARGLGRGIVLVLVLLTACASSRQYSPGANPKLPYSAAVRVGRTVYISGHLGVDPATKTAPARIEDEIEIMLDRFAATLRRTGLTMDHMVQMQVHCPDVDLYQTFNDIYRKRFTANFPARAFVGSGKLLRGCHFEILGIAEE